MPEKHSNLSQASIFTLYFPFFLYNITSHKSATYRSSFQILFSFRRRTCFIRKRMKRGSFVFV